MSHKYYFLSTLFAAMMVSCSVPKDISKLTPEDIKMQLTMGACFGKCPVYTLSVYEGGHVKLSALRFGKREGDYTKNLTKKEYKSLVKVFETANVYQFKDRYETDISDLPMVSIGYKGNSGFKIIRGWDERPSDIKALQGLLEHLYNEDDWDLVKKRTTITLYEEPNEVMREKDPTIIEDKIIIKVKKGVRLSAWLKEIEKDGVQLVKRVSEENNIWLVTYDSNQYRPQEILRIIQNHADIEMAEFDKIITDR